MTDFNGFRFEAAFGTAEQLPELTIPEIAFSGRSNVGKSSLLNKLCSRKALAKTSSFPGKTVTVNFFTNGNARLVDLPGYGFQKTRDSEKKRWALLMEAYFNSGREISLVVQLLDIRHKPSADDITMLNFLSETGYPFIVVLTKSDKLNKTDTLKRREEFESGLNFGQKEIFECSVLTGSGMPELRNYISSLI